VHTAVPKILLLVNTPPDSAGIGELFLKEVVPYYPVDRLVRYSTVQSTVHKKELNWCGFRTYVRQVKASALPLISIYFDNKFRNCLLDDMVDEIRTIIEINKIDMIWAVLNSGITIHLVNRLIELFDLPVVSTIWDSPQYFVINQHLNNRTANILYQSFENILRKSTRVSVISEEMRNIYEEKYSVNGIVWRHGIPRKLWQENSRHLDGNFIIGFAGSMYAKEEWNTLVKAIDSVNGIIGGKKVVLRFIGRFPRRSAKKSESMELLGQMSMEDTIKSLSKVDLAYLPYWFKPKYDYVVKTAFPGKLSTYLAADVPVFYHGPLDSSPTKFIYRYPIGLCCHSLDEKEVLRVLNDFISDSSLHNKFKAARKEALEKELSSEIMLDRFASIVGIKRQALMPCP
jgi:hypothetical protein